MVFRHTCYDQFLSLVRNSRTEIDDGPHILQAIVAVFDAIDPTRSRCLAIADKAAFKLGQI